MTRIEAFKTIYPKEYLKLKGIIKKIVDGSITEWEIEEIIDTFIYNIVQMKKESGGENEHNKQD